MVFFSLPFTVLILHAQIITTVVGNHISGYSGDGGPATSAELSGPLGIGFDAGGDFYVVDDVNYIIRKVDNTGIINTYSGNYLLGQGYSGDGGPATNAELNGIDRLCFDTSGNLYLSNADVIREVTKSTGIINTIAGDHHVGYYGDGGPATSAEFSFTSGVTISSIGNLYISDGNDVIRMIEHSSGIINTIAGNHSLGNGYSGDGGAATAAQFTSPEDVCFDISGNIYIADVGNNVIRKVDTFGIISTIAGNYIMGAGYSGDGGSATSAELNNPRGIVFDHAGNLYFADEANNVIREVNTSGTISTIAGNYIKGAGYSGDNGLATAAQLHYPNAVTLDKQGNLYISDGFNYVVRKVSGVTTLTQAQLTMREEATVYPNPSNGSFTLSISNVTEKCNVQIYNIIGEKIYHSEVNSSNTKMNLSGQPQGIYLYSVINENGGLVGSGKLIIE